MKNSSMLLMLVFLIGCGAKSGKDSNSSDNGLLKVQNQEKQIVQGFEYNFTDSENLSDLECRDDFLKSALLYLKLSKNYFDKMIDQKKIDSSDLNSVVQKHNLLLTDSLTLTKKWGASCENKNILSISQRPYKSNLKTKIDFGANGNRLIKSLEKIKNYKASLSRVLESLESGSTPDLEDVAIVHIHQQVLFSKEKPIVETDVNKLLNRLNNISDRLSPDVTDKSLGEFKAAYEKVIESQLQSPILYNKAYFSVSSKIFKGKTQCLGGTKTDLLMNILVRGVDEYYQRRPVVILSSGHILPGFVIGTKAKWHLYGVETTTAGNSEVYYGDLKNISNLEDKILVLDAFDYLYINAVQFYLKNPSEIVKKSLQNFAKKYKIENFEGIFHGVVSEKTTNTNNEILNKDIFAVGKNTQASGTFPRKWLESSSKVQGRFLNPKSIETSLLNSGEGSQLVSFITSFQESLTKYQALSIPLDSKSYGNSIYGDNQFVQLDEGHYNCRFSQFRDPINLKVDKLNDLFMIDDDLEIKGIQVGPSRFSFKGNIELVVNEGNRFYEYNNSMPEGFSVELLNFDNYRYTQGFCDLLE